MPLVPRDRFEGISIHTFLVYFIRIDTADDEETYEATVKT